MAKKLKKVEEKPKKKLKKFLIRPKGSKPYVVEAENLKEALKLNNK